MKLLAFLESLKPLNEGIMDAMIETAIPGAIERLRAEMSDGSYDTNDMRDMSYSYHYGEDYPVDDADVHPEAEARFQEWLAEWTEARVHTAVGEIVNGMQYNSHAHLNGIVIHRVIKATEDFPSQIDVRGLGEYWSWDEHAAEAHWGGDGDIVYHIVGLVDPKHVDWEHSLFQNAHPSYEHEAELYIPEGSPIELYRLLLGNGDEIQPEQYGGRQMMAASIGESIELDEGPEAFADIAISPKEIKDSLIYFLVKHAPERTAEAGETPKTLGVLDTYYDVVSYPINGGQFLFLLDIGRPVLYVAIDQYKDGVAIGNVRSTGKYPASKFYYYILKNISDVLYSDSAQTSGGRKVWADLAKHYPDVNVTDVGDRLRATIGENVTENSARFARSSELREAAGGQFVYHATMAKNLGTIMGKGLTFFNPSLWVKAGSPDERYQDEPSVFAFEHPVDAWRWAAKMEWEFKEPAVVITFKRGNSWGQDPSDDISLQMGKGKALQSHEPIPASDIVGAKTVAQIGTPVSTGLHGEEYEQHVEDTLTS